MEERTSRQPRYRLPGGRGSRLRSRAFRRGRAVLLAACAAVLALALAAGVHSAAQARSAVVASGSVPHSLPPEAGAAAPPAGTTAGSATGAIDPALDSELNAIIAGNPEYQIGVALLDLSDGANKTVHQYGVGEPFVAASTAKVLAAEAYYHLVETGAASLDEQLGAYSAAFQLQAMIQQSDNDSWSLIMDAVGHEELTDYAASLGVEYSPESNTLTPSDMARILARLYSGSLLDAGDTAELLATMQDTNDETLIPAAVPAGITVFHKYGALDGELHDAGILAKDGHAYALVVYTKGEDLSSVPERREIIHQLTSAVTHALF
jgi:beta-lactamase class A